MIKFIELKNIEKLKREVKLALFALGAVFIISLLAWALSKPGIRYNFYFESVDTGKLAVEHRYLPAKRYPENVLQYADELVLGPQTERFRLLFSSGTYVVSRFVRDGVLYINLSEDVLDKAGSCSEIKTGIELFKKNVLSSFSKINSVEMYIDNKSVYAHSEEDSKK